MKYSVTFIHNFSLLNEPLPTIEMEHSICITVSRLKCGEDRYKLMIRNAMTKMAHCVKEKGTHLVSFTCCYFALIIKNLLWFIERKFRSEMKYLIYFEEKILFLQYIYSVWFNVANWVSNNTYTYFIDIS